MLLSLYGSRQLGTIFFIRAANGALKLLDCCTAEIPARKQDKLRQHTGHRRHNYSIKVHIHENQLPVVFAAQIVADNPVD
jgi:hypothetical protein